MNNSNQLPEAFINTQNLSDTNELKFIKQEFVRKGFTDVLYKGTRIAIINGNIRPLQWVGKNGDVDVPIRILNSLEKYCMNNINQNQ